MPHDLGHRLPLPLLLLVGAVIATLIIMVPRWLPL